METRDQLKQIKIKAAGEHLSALAVAVEALESLVDASEGRRDVLVGITCAINALKKHLEKLDHDDTLVLLTEEELEAKIHLSTRVIPYLHELLGTLENSDVSSVPSELITPINRVVKKFFPFSKLFVVSSSDLNYSFIELSQFLREIWEELQCKEPDDKFPEQIFRAHPVLPYFN